MSAAESSSESRDSGGGGFEISISVRTILLVAVAAAIAWAVASIASVLLTIFISLFNVAVLLPVVSSLERRFRWSRGLSASVLVVATLLLVVVVLLVLALAVGDAVRGLSHNLPHILDQVRHSGLGKFLNGGSGWVDTLRKHASDITMGVGKASGGIAHVGASAFGVVTLALSVVFLTLFGLIGAIIAVPIAAGIQIVVEELTAARRARIAAADAAEQQQA